MVRLSYEEYSKLYTVHKTSLKSIIKDDNNAKIINDAVINVNKIVIHTYNFLKIYYLHNYIKNKTIVDLDLPLLRTICKVLCNKESRGRKLSQQNQKLYDEIETFHNKYYKSIMIDDDLTSTHLSNVIEYELVSMLTNIKNHIQLHFYEYICRYINILTDKYNKEDVIKNDKGLTKKDMKTKLSELYKCIDKVKKDVFDKTITCDKKYYDVVNKINNMFPKISKNQTVLRHVNNEPLVFLPMLINISLDIEKRNMSTINCFPLRKHITPKYITLDTVSILYMFPFGGTQSRYVNDTALFGDYIWSKFFKTDKKIFKQSKYVFNNMIYTDGIGCSILLKNKVYKNVTVRATQKPRTYRSDLYIDELEDNIKKHIKKTMIVGIDPGKDDLIYATNGVKSNGKMMTFRYSQNQRRKELKSKKYRDFIKHDRVSTKTEKMESKLSEFNSKSCVLKNVIAYIRNKNKINSKIYDVYNKVMYRKLKWFSFINKQRSESNMVNQFKKRFNVESKDATICIGDFEQKKQMKYKEPTKGKSFRNLFKKAGFKVYLVDEYKTSAISHITFEPNEKFRKRGNPRPWKENIKLLHGLLRSKNVIDNKTSDGKHVLVNRDLNGALNIRLKALYAIRNKLLPKCFRRASINQNT